MESVTAHSEREWIFVGMAERCATQGFGATTVEDICESAGVSRASFDDLFAGKEACLEATVESAVGEARAAVAEAVSSRQTWAASLRDGAAALLGFLAGRPTLGHVLLLDAPIAGGRAADLAESGHAELLAFLERGREHAAVEIPASRRRRHAAAPPSRSRIVA